MSFAPPPTDVPGKGGEPPAATNAEQLLPPPPPPPSDGGAAAVVMTATSAREVAAGRGIYRLDGWALRAQAGHAADELPFEDPFEGFKLTDSIVSGLFATVCLGTVAIAYWKTKRTYNKELVLAGGEVLEADLVEGQRLAARGLLIATALTSGTFSGLVFGVSQWMGVDTVQEFSVQARGSLRGVSATIEGWFKEVNTLPSVKTENDAPSLQSGSNGNGTLRGAGAGVVNDASSFPPIPRSNGGGGGGGGGGSRDTDGGAEKKKEVGGLQWWGNYFAKKKKAKETEQAADTAAEP